MKNSHTITKKDIMNLSCFFCFDRNGLLATAFSHLPLFLKRHGIQVGATAALMAAYAPDNAILHGMDRKDYANAVRYGGFYHDIGAYLVYNQRNLYPGAGERLLREQVNEREITPEARQVLIETVHRCQEHYDGSGVPDHLTGTQIPLHAEICNIANHVDYIASKRPSWFHDPLKEADRFVCENVDHIFSPEAVECFKSAKAEIFALYKKWYKSPPFWHSSDLRIFERPIGKEIG